MESWRGYLNEAPQLLDPPLMDDPKNIETIGQLHDYYMSKEPSLLKKLANKYGGISARVLGLGAGLAAGGLNPAAGAAASAAAGTIAEAIVENLLMSAVITFANIEDGSYAAGSISSYFDLDDNLTMFLRDLQTQGKEITKPSKPELEAYKEIQQIIKNAITSGADPKVKISDLLQDLTTQAILDDRIRTGEYSGKVDVQTMD